MSPSVARITGPGAVPLYVQAGKKMPGAISRSLSSAIERVLAHAAGLCGTRGRRIEERVEIVRAADRGHLGPDHRRVARRPATATGKLSRIVAVNVARVAVAAGLRLAVEGELSHERHRRERSRGGEQLATGQRLFSHS